MSTYNWFVIFGILQLMHSQEEIWTGFHEKWFLHTMPRYIFIAFEVILSGSILLYMFNPNIVGSSVYMPWFIFAMLLNGMEHIIWGAVKRSYVPGLITAPLFIILFAVYYSSLI